MFAIPAVFLNSLLLSTSVLCYYPQTRECSHLSRVKLTTHSIIPTKKDTLIVPSQ